MASSPAIRDTALLTPEATPASLEGTDSITAVVSGATLMARPMPSVARIASQIGTSCWSSSAIAILAKPALPPDFPYFPYVNPDAPKGGDVTLATIGTYDSFNPFILRGTATYGMVSPWVVLPGGSGSGSSVGHAYTSRRRRGPARLRGAARYQLIGVRLQRRDLQDQGRQKAATGTDATR